MSRDRRLVPGDFPWVFAEPTKTLVFKEIVLSNPVDCPVCHGTKQNPFDPNNGQCRCCNGVGQISAEKALALARIRKDLAQRLFERGIPI